MRAASVGRSMTRSGEQGEAPWGNRGARERALSLCLRALQYRSGLTTSASAPDRAPAPHRPYSSRSPVSQRDARCHRAASRCGLGGRGVLFVRLSRICPPESSNPRGRGTRFFHNAAEIARPDWCATSRARGWRPGPGSRYSARAFGMETHMPTRIGWLAALGAALVLSAGCSSLPGSTRGTDKKLRDGAEIASAVGERTRAEYEGDKDGELVRYASSLEDAHQDPPQPPRMARTGLPRQRAPTPPKQTQRPTPPRAPRPPRTRPTKTPHEEMGPTKRAQTRPRAAPPPRRTPEASPPPRTKTPRPKTPRRKKTPPPKPARRPHLETRAASVGL